jgi:hypothetical protein
MISFSQDLLNSYQQIDFNKYIKTPEFNEDTHQEFSQTRITDQVSLVYSEIDQILHQHMHCQNIQNEESQKENWTSDSHLNSADADWVVELLTKSDQNRSLSILYEDNDDKQSYLESSKNSLLLVNEGICKYEGFVNFNLQNVHTPVSNAPIRATLPKPKPDIKAHLKKQNPLLKKTVIEWHERQMDDLDKLKSEQMDVACLSPVELPIFLIEKMPKELQHLQLPHLSARAFVAKIQHHCSVKKIPTVANCNLSLVERIAIYAYSVCAYLEMNELLYKERDSFDNNIESTLQLIRYTMSGLKKLPSSNAQYLYRGVHLTAQEFTVYKIGQLVQERRFLSTSATTRWPLAIMRSRTSKDIRVLFVITNFRNGKDISKFSNSKSEDEVLFPPGCTFRVVSIKMFQERVNPDQFKSSTFLPTHIKNQKKALFQQQALVELEEVNEKHAKDIGRLEKSKPLDDRIKQISTKSHLIEIQSKQTHNPDQMDSFQLKCIPKSGTTTPIMIPIGNLSVMLKLKNSLAIVFKIINRATLNQPYACTIYDYITIDGVDIYRPNHNGTHSARKVGHLNVILELIAQTGTINAKKMVNGFTPDERINLQLAVYCMRAGRVDESSSKIPNPDDFHLRSAQVYEAYAKQLGFLPETIEFFSILIKNSGKPKSARSAKEIDADPKKLMCHLILYVVHNLDLIRISVADEAFKLDIQDALKQILQLEQKGMDELLNQLLKFAEELLNITDAYKQQSLFKRCSLEGDFCWESVNAASLSFLRKLKQVDRKK